MIETLVIALHPYVAVDVKSDRVEFLQFFFFFWRNEICKEGDSESK